MVDAEQYARIEQQHGPDCTCRRLDPINFQPVIVTPGCPGDRSPHIAVGLAEPEPRPYPGRIAITWPANAGHAALEPWQMTVHDHDTGEQLIGITGLRIILGGDQWNTKQIHADLTMLVDARGNPATNPIVPVPNDTGRPRRGDFRALVAEMRITPHDPTIPTRESVNRGEHTLDQYREYHGIDGARAELAILDEAQGFSPDPSRSTT